MAIVPRTTWGREHDMRTEVRLGRCSQSLLRALLAAAIAACLPAYAAMAQSRPTADAATDFNIPARDLAGALDRFSTQTGIQVVYQPELVASRQSKALTGRLTWRQALEALLQGSGLEYQQADDNTVVIRRQGNTRSPAAVRPAAATPTAPADGEGTEVTDLGRMMVTGTRIRGGVTPSPVIGISAAQIQEEGFADLGEVVRSVPQNFRGGQNPEVPAGNLGLGLINQNVTGGSGLNLRGLGPDASLTLLNGRRMSYSGFLQALDISVIPVEAVDRVEIVPDGASAIYGSDAVGGVGNVILRRDFDGVMLGARYGTATAGGLTTREYTATAGHTWSSGGLIAVYKDISADPIYARQRNYASYLADPTMIYPRNDLRTGLLSAHQSLGDVAELTLDALKSVRDQTSIHFLSSQPQYYRAVPETSSSLMSPSLEFFLPNDWTLSIGATWGKDETAYKYSLDTISTGASTLLYDYCYCNELRTYELGTEGPLFELPGGDARIAAGAGHRRNEFQQIIEVGAGLQDVHGDESSRFAYVEISLPLVSAATNIVGVERLLVTAAARTEDYDSFGRVTTPQFGLIYGPSEDFSLKGSWGKSFKAPTLNQLNFISAALLYPAAIFGGTGYPAGSTAIYLQGGNPALRPERAKTWNASLAFHPTALPNLQAELTWFNIDYTDRVVAPLTNITQGLSNPAYAAFVEYSPTAESQAQVLADADSFLNATGSPYDPSSVVAILHGRFANVVRQRIKGVDLSGSYRFDLGDGQLMIRGSASWLDSSQQSNQGQASTNLAGTLFNPAKVNSRLGLVWNHSDFTISAFANYIGGVTDAVNDHKGGSFTTFDTTLRYIVGKQAGFRQGGATSSPLEFALSAQNLFNREPPLHTPASLIYSTPYDPTNYSAIGRFVSLSVSKHW